MTEVAGETCDGVIVHGFTERYIREVTIPARERSRKGWQDNGWLPDPAAFVVTSNNKNERSRRRKPEQQMRSPKPTLPTGARTPWMGRNARRTQPPLESRRLVKMGEAIDDEFSTPSSLVSPTDCSRTQGRWDIVDRLVLLPI